MSIEVGKVVEGVVTGITKFGAFVDLPGKVRGLVHISEVSSDYVRDVNDFLKINDRVKVKVLSVDGKGKVGLSIRQATETKKHVKKQNKAAENATFEDKLSKFLKESDERQQQIKKSTDLKRGGRGAARK